MSDMRTIESELTLAKWRIAELEKELALCEPFLKENETPAMCIARNRTDVNIALGLYAGEVKKRETLEAELDRLNSPVQLSIFAESKTN